MHRPRVATSDILRPKNGFCIFAVGPLLEILVMGTAVALVVTALCQVQGSTLSQSRLAEQHALKGYLHPIRSLNLDLDRQMLMISAWPDFVGEVDLETKVYSSKLMPRFVASIATSERNSTTIILTCPIGSNGVSFEIHVIRQDALLLSHAIPSEGFDSPEISVSRDGSVALVSSENGLIFGWDLRDANPVRWEYRLKHRNQASCLSPDGRWLFSTEGFGTSGIYDSRTGEIVMSLPEVESCRRMATWSKDSQRLAFSKSEHALIVVQAATGETLCQPHFETASVRSLALSSDGNILAVAGFDKQIHLHDLSNTDESHVNRISTSSITCDMVFTNSDQSIICGSDDGTVREWSRATRDLIRRFR